jgi:hypothetical protein
MSRNVTAAPEKDSFLDWDCISGRDDPQQRFRIYRLCECGGCDGLGKLYAIKWTRCPECRGEGRTLDLVATCGSPAGVGMAIVQLGREGELAECPVGVLDLEGEKDQKWLVSPWLPSTRNVTDAARLLASQKGESHVQHGNHL